MMRVLFVILFMFVGWACKLFLSYKYGWVVAIGQEM